MRIDNGTLHHKSKNAWKPIPIEIPNRGKCHQSHGSMSEKKGNRPPSQNFLLSSTA